MSPDLREVRFRALLTDGNVKSLYVKDMTFDETEVDLLNSAFANEKRNFFRNVGFKRCFFPSGRVLLPYNLQYFFCGTYDDFYQFKTTIPHSVTHLSVAISSAEQFKNLILDFKNENILHKLRHVSVTYNGQKPMRGDKHFVNITAEFFGVLSDPRCSIDNLSLHDIQVGRAFLPLLDKCKFKALSITGVFSVEVTKFILEACSGHETLEHLKIGNISRPPPHALLKIANNNRLRTICFIGRQPLWSYKNYFLGDFSRAMNSNTSLELIELDGVGFLTEDFISLIQNNQNGKIVYRILGWGRYQMHEINKIQREMQHRKKFFLLEYIKNNHQPNLVRVFENALAFLPKNYDV